MELLIPGLILVALMVYASTKIKKNAARAYERETIETPEFSIVKPEGFICPVDHDADLVFAAYSKEYGRDRADSVRQASAEIRSHNGADLNDICEKVRRDSAQIVSEDGGILNGKKSIVIYAEREKRGVSLETISKIMAADGKIFELTVSVLPENKDDYLQRTDECLASFVIK